jgi:hypothetical protein
MRSGGRRCWGARNGRKSVAHHAGSQGEHAGALQEVESGEGDGERPQHGAGAGNESEQRQTHRRDPQAGLQRPGLCRPPPRRRLPPGEKCVAQDRRAAARPDCGAGNRPFTPSAIQPTNPSNGGGAGDSRRQATMSSQSGTAWKAMTSSSQALRAATACTISAGLLIPTNTASRPRPSSQAIIAKKRVRRCGRQRPSSRVSLMRGR